MVGQTNMAADRRSFLGGIGSSAFLLLAGCASTGVPTGQPARRFFADMGKPIGLQIYLLGPDVGKDLDASFAKVAQIGYRTIEIPNLFGKSAQEVRAAADRAGLKITSVHVPLVEGAGMPGLTFASAPNEIADTLGALGAEWAVAPIMMLPKDFAMQQGESFGDALSRSVLAAGPDLWKRSAGVLNNVADALKPLGVRVGYHNHNVEFAPVGDSNGWDILLRETDPELVYFEVDVGWVATAGLDPVAFLEQGRGRYKLMHVKDVASDNKQSFAIGMSPAEVGSGVLDWAKILPAAQRAGIEHYYVEQEPPFAIPRIDAAAKSYAYLADLRI